MATRVAFKMNCIQMKIAAIEDRPTGSIIFTVVVDKAILIDVDP